jgi:ribosomal protein L28
MRSAFQPMQLRTITTKTRIPKKRKTWRPPAYPRIPAGVPSFASEPHATYKLRNKILAGGKTIHFGNTVSEHFNRTRRIWRPNIKVKPLWSDGLGQRVRLRMVTSVLRTVDKVGGLDAYLTCSKRGRMKELGPRGWEIRAAVIQALKETERAKYVRLFQRSILLCPELRMDSQWKDIRPLIRHTEGYAVLPEEDCKKAFKTLMERLRDGRPMVRRRNLAPKPIVLTPYKERKLLRRARALNMPRRQRQYQYAGQQLVPRGQANIVTTAETVASPESKPKMSKREKAHKRAERKANAAKLRSKKKQKQKAQLA